ncbi:MAG: hypothetical protein AVDCRST_MAG27-3444 [uncultured Craurococcus sp.]|uniref:DUF2842 domain-containing protein n=1 Tax=uncultured Craurococcus sp. TaxID=1135998 RepID=A0A6J4JHC6_9PROT|nr:MAG: hypothetical protein AVDCRST_MAG27-3444 [uncultured Craurococcus sp.]
MQRAADRSGLGEGAWLGHVQAMSRTSIATLVGLSGFLAYVVGVVTLADHVLQMHWAVQALFFLVAGTVWTLPATKLIVWAAGGR